MKNRGDGKLRLQFSANHDISGLENFCERKSLKLGMSGNSAASIVPKSTVFKHVVPMRTRWVDEDNQKVLNNAVFMTLFEEARLSYFGKTNLDLIPLSLTFPFVLLKTDVRFLKPGRGGRAILVDIKTTKLTRTSFVQLYRVRDAEANDLWAEAEAVLVCYDFERANQKMDIPDYFRAKVSQFEGIPMFSEDAKTTRLTDEKRAQVQTNYDGTTLKIGHWAEITKRIGEREVRMFATISEDKNPIHLDPEYCKSTRFKRPIAHGWLSGSLFSGLLGMVLPGHGTVYLSQNVVFRSPVFVGDEITARVEVKEIDYKRRIVSLTSYCKNAQGKVVLDGECKVMVVEDKLQVQSKL